MSGSKILHGPPDPEDLARGCKSLGEYCLKQFRSYNGSDMILVSLLCNSLSCVKMISYF